MRQKHWVIIAFVALILGMVGIGCFLLSDSGFRSVVLPCIGKRLNIPISVSHADIRFFSYVELNDLRVGAGEQPVLEARRVRMDASLFDLLRGKHVINRFQLDDGHAALNQPTPHQPSAENHTPKSIPTESALTLEQQLQSFFTLLHGWVIRETAIHLASLDWQTAGKHLVLKDAHLNLKNLAPDETAVLDLKGVQCEWIQSSGNTPSMTGEINISASLKTSENGNIVHGSAQLTTSPVQWPMFHGHTWPAKPCTMRGQFEGDIDFKSRELHLASLAMSVGSELTQPLIDIQIDNPLSFGWSGNKLGSGFPKLDSPAALKIAMYEDSPLVVLQGFGLQIPSEAKAGPASITSTIIFDPSGKEIRFSMQTLCSKLNVRPTKDQPNLHDIQLRFSGRILQSPDAWKVDDLLLKGSTNGAESLRMSGTAEFPRGHDPRRCNIRFDSVRETFLQPLAGLLDDVRINGFNMQGNLDIADAAPSASKEKGKLVCDIKTRFDDLNLSSSCLQLDKGWITLIGQVSACDIKSFTFQGFDLALGKNEKTLISSTLKAATLQVDPEGRMSAEGSATIQSDLGLLAPVLRSPEWMKNVRSGDFSTQLHIDYTKNTRLHLQIESSIKKLIMQAGEILPPPIQLNLKGDVAMETAQGKVTFSPGARLLYAAGDQPLQTFTLKEATFVNNPQQNSMALAIEGEELDLTPIFPALMPSPADGTAQPPSRQIPSVELPPATTAPVPGANLPSSDFMLSVSIKKIQIPGLALTDILIPLFHLSNKGLELQKSSFAINDGRIEMSVTSSPAGGGVFDYSILAEKIPLGPIVNAFNPELKDRVSGELTGDMSGSGVAGVNGLEILRGGLKLSIDHAKLEHLSIVNKSLKTLGAILESPDIASSTVNHVAATGVMDQGVVQAQHIEITGSSIEMDLQGKIDCVRQGLDMTAVLKLTPETMNRSSYFGKMLTNLGDMQDKKYQLPGQILIRGTFEEPKVLLDRTKLTRNIIIAMLKDPQKIKYLSNQLQNEKGTLQGVLGILKPVDAKSQPGSQPGTRSGF